MTPKIENFKREFKEEIAMLSIPREVVERLKREYPAGTRVELISMKDPYNTILKPGCRGTITSVDDIGTIHVKWDCGSSLGVCYREDQCKII